MPTNALSILRPISGAWNGHWPLSPDARDERRRRGVEFSREILELLARDEVDVGLQFAGVGEDFQQRRGRAAGGVLF